jgi:alanine racemase
MNRDSEILLSEEAVKNNIHFLKKKLGSQVKISSVVKSNAYGHGIEKVVPLFQKYGIDHFSVFDFAEAERVCNSITGPCGIMIMGWIPDDRMKKVLERGYEFFVYNIDRLNLALKAAKKTKTKAKIHLEAETGMNRTGFNTAQLKKAIEIINNNRDCFDVVGFCTHLAGPESISNHLRIQKQLKNYQKMLAVLRNEGIQPTYRHVANSAGAFSYPKTRMDMVRIGIMQYGFWPSMETFIQYVSSKTNKTDPLQRIMSWHSRVMSVKEVKTGEFIGYGITFLAQTDTKTALIPIGYASGFSRSLSNRGRVLIHGQRCRVVGLVNMNMIIVDVTHVKDVKVGDEAVIIGKQGDLEIKVTAFSDIGHLLNYEVLAHLSQRIFRRVV